MDPLTHILLGANLGYAAGGRILGRTAALAGGLAAFLPDADIFIRSAADPLVAIEHHRGFTHSLLFVPVGAAIVAGCWWFRPRWRARGRGLALWCCCALAYLSHVLLDAATSYGTQLLWPFSNVRAGWDLVSVVDLLVTLPLLAGLLWALGARRPRPALAALAVAAGYILLGGVQHERASMAQRELASARGHRIERAEVMPTLANNIVWRALYEHDGRIYADRIRVGWFSPAAVREGWSLPVVTADDLLPEERRRNERRSFERFAWFSDRWIARSPADPMVLADMRYTLSAEAFDPIWGIRFNTAAGATEVAWINRSRERKVSPGELWSEIAGGDLRFRALPR